MELMTAKNMIMMNYQISLRLCVGIFLFVTVTLSFQGNVKTIQAIDRADVNVEFQHEAASAVVSTTDGTSQPSGNTTVATNVAVEFEDQSQQRTTVEDVETSPNDLPREAVEEEPAEPLETETTSQEAGASTPSKHEYPFSFAACVITKDDNQILPEWLAYHYTVLPLRYLIIAVDPLSLTSPEWIFDLYQKHLPDLKIEIWKGHSYMYNGRWWIQQKGSFHPNKTDLPHKHQFEFKRWRQNTFLTTCLRELKHGRPGAPLGTNFTWTMMFDTDEYIAYNTVSDGNDELARHNISATHPRTRLPPYIGRQNETIAHWIQAQQDDSNKNDTDVHFNAHHKPCVQLPIIRMQTPPPDKDVAALNASLWQHMQQESLPQRQDAEKDPLFDIAAFHTLQFRQHQAKLNSEFAKSLIDVSRYNGNTQVVNVHYPFQDGQCHFPKPWSNGREVPLRMQTYTGTLKTFLSRPTFRRPQDFEERNNFAVEGFEHGMAHWLHEFVRLVGNNATVAYELTQGARERAYQETLQLKQQLETTGENLTAIYDWDDNPDLQLQAKLPGLTYW